MERALQFEDYRRTELIDGKTYMMSPPIYRHNSIGGNLYSIIWNYLRGKRCRVAYDTMVYFDEKNKFIPDLAVVCDREKIKVNGIHGAPDLIIEILSPSTKKRDIGIKKDTYEKFGVKEYWIVSPKEKSVEVYLLTDGKFVLDNVYSDFDEPEWEMLDEEERAGQKLSLKLSLYDDLEIKVKDIFEE